MALSLNETYGIKAFCTVLKIKSINIHKLRTNLMLKLEKTARLISKGDRCSVAWSKWLYAHSCLSQTELYFKLTMLKALELLSYNKL